MGALSSSPLILRCILRRPPSLTFLKLYKNTSSYQPPLSTPPHFLISPRTFCTITSTPTVISEDTEKEKEAADDDRIANEHKEMMSKLREMSVKDKKELGSYANSLGKKLKSQQVGKSGVTDSVAVALLETLEANELLKIYNRGNVESSRSIGGILVRRKDR
ncbi:putative RNA-binding, CRM domain-containing protein [Tanacetum coccineum]